MTPDELTEYLTMKLGDHIAETTFEADTYTVTTTREGYVPVVELCRDDPRVACDMFDCSFGVDEREDGFSVVNVLYSTTHRHRILVKLHCDGGRENPTAPTITHLYEGADWNERETWDMFGIEFEGHPSLAPRILTAENFEGWPLRKDFWLATREAKPWPGIKEPAELDEEGNLIVKEPGPGGAPGPTPLDEAMAAQAKAANPEPEPQHTQELTEAQQMDTSVPAGMTATEAQPEEAMAAGSSDEPGVSEQASTSGGADQPTTTPDIEHSDAESKADEQRKAAAEARAKKAEERAAQGGSSPDGDVEPIPSADELREQNADGASEAGDDDQSGEDA